MTGKKFSNLFLLKHFNGKFPVDIEEMMFYEGIIFNKTEIKDDIAKVNSDIKAISISEKVSEGFQRFLIAYCIGHLLIENKNDSFKSNKLAYIRINDKNNQILDFAMNLLMPEKIFISVFKDLQADIDKISIYFNVPKYITFKRIDQLQLQHLTSV